MVAKRTICKEKYIDDYWLLNKIDNIERCPLCHCMFYIVLDEENNVRCNVSVDRLDNDIEHTKQNCHLLCIECNKSKK